ncbi:MAG: twin-arginine translocase subunit TatC, partial [Bdellovibrio sp.]
MTQEEEPQTLIDHLIDLRKCLKWSFFYILIGFLVSWFFFREQIFDFIRAPISPYLKDAGGGLIFTAPMDKFLAYIKVCFFSGIIISSPFWIHQIWLFVAPALYKKEKRLALTFIFFGTVLFFSGAAFVYFVVYPMAFSFLMTFGSPADKAFIEISRYLSFFTTTMVVFGLAFEMPLIMTLLGMFGVIDEKFLSEKRRYAIVLIAALSAVFTPPDVISMFLMMLPMLFLYELSIV